MAHKPEIRQACRNSYVFDRLSLPDAANSAGVSYNTARVWKKNARESGDDWDKARIAARLTEGGLGDLTRMVLSEFTHQFQATLEQLKGFGGNPVDAAQAMTRLADAYVKMVGAASKAEPGITRQGIALDVLRLLSEFIRSKYPQHLGAFAEVLEPFGAHVQQEMAGSPRA